MRHRAPERAGGVEERSLHIFDLCLTALVLLVAVVASNFTLASTNLTQTDDSVTAPSPDEVSGGFNPPGTATSSVVVYGTGTDADVRLVASAGMPVSTEYTAVGAHTWTAPAGVSSVQIELWGGGGDGGDGNGGGGGAYSKTNSYGVTGGENYAVYVGAPPSVDSYFVDSSTALAKGGQSDGSGGQAAQSIGDVKYSGDDGATGGADGQGQYAGGGGYGAGSGGTGTGGTGGTGSDEYSWLPGTSGSQPGGGGGGGLSYFGLGSGAGAPGQAILTYSVPVYAASGVYKSYVDGGTAAPNWSTFALTKTSTAGGVGTIAVKIKTSASSATPPTFNASGAACDFSVSANGSSGAKDLTTCTNLGTERYLWYQATLSTADENASPLVEEVVVALTTDATAPTITLTGNASVSLTVGDAYTDAGATASDDVDGNVTASIVTTGSVNTATAGTYTLTYTVSDAAGNAATPVTRTVTVAAAASGGSVSHSNSRSSRSAPAPVPAPPPAEKTVPAAPVIVPVPSPAVDPVEPKAAEVLVEEPIETESVDLPPSEEAAEESGDALESSGSVSSIRDAASAFLQNMVAPVQAAAEVGQQIAKETADVAAPVAAPVGLAAAATALASGTVSATLSMIGTALFQVGALAALYLAVTQPSLLTAGIVLMYILVALMRRGSGRASRTLRNALHGSRK